MAEIEITANLKVVSYFSYKRHVDFDEDQCPLDQLKADFTLDRKLFDNELLLIEELTSRLERGDRLLDVLTNMYPADFQEHRLNYGRFVTENEIVYDGVTYLRNGYKQVGKLLVPEYNIQIVDRTGIKSRLNAIADNRLRKEFSDLLSTGADLFCRTYFPDDDCLMWDVFDKDKILVLKRSQLSLR